MKKLTASVLAAACAVLVLTGCGNRTEHPESGGSGSKDKAAEHSKSEHSESGGSESKDKEAEHSTEHSE